MNSSSLTSSSANVSSLSVTAASANTVVVTSITGTNAYFPGTYQNPVRIGVKRLWYDTVNDVLRVSASDPTSETDGYALTEGNI
jgi:hypothetical protein